jgi:hypothetical protein
MRLSLGAYLLAFHAYAGSRGIFAGSSKAVSQLLWPDKDREVWFSLGENHEKADDFPDFLQRSAGREQ